MAKKGTKVTNRITKKQLLELLIDLFNRYPEEQLDTRNVFDRLGLKSTAVKGLCMQLLDDLVFDGYLVETTAHKYRLAAKSSVICGTFKRNSDGYNLVYPEDEGEPIVIPERKSAHALTDDYVRVTLYAHRRGRGREGEIIEIIKRAHDTFVGILRVQKHYAFLVTESRVMPADIFIPRDKLKGGKSGDKAVVKLMEWPAESRNPIGCVVDVLGRAGDNDAEMNAILAEYDLPYIYPQAVEAAANKLLTDITKEEIARREDFRDGLCFLG